MISISLALIGYNVFDPDKQLKHDIQTLKLNKKLHDVSVLPTKIQQSLNDSIKTADEFYEVQTKNVIGKRKLEYIENSNVKGLDSLRALEK